MSKKEDVIKYLNNHTNLKEKGFDEVTEILAKECNVSKGTARNYYSYWKKEVEEDEEIEEAAKKILNIIDEDNKETVDMLFEENIEKRKQFKEEALKDLIGKQAPEVKKEEEGPKESKLKIKALEGEHAEYEIKNNGVLAIKEDIKIFYNSLEELNKIEEDTIKQVKEEANEVREAFRLGGI